MREQQGNRSKTVESIYRAMGRLTIALVIFFFCPTIARGADRTWSNSAGGVFSSPANWLGGTAPSSSDTANFNLNSDAPYAVTLSAAATVTRLMLDQDNVQLDLSGFTLTASTGTLTDPSLVVSETAGGTSSLDVRNGTLATTYAKIGDFGNGTVILSNAAKISSSGTVYLGFRDGAYGAVTMSGAGTSWSAASHAIGNSGNASLTVSNGASLVTTTSSSIGGSVNSHAFVTITGAGSTWTGAQNSIIAGSGGHGTLTVNNNGVVLAKAISIGKSAGSVGTVNLDGATASGRSTMTLVGGSGLLLAVADSGTGTLNITNGALLTTPTDCLVAYEPGATGTIAVSGAAAGNNAELRISGAMQIARSLPDNASAGGGNASITIGAGGSITVGGATYLGSTGVGAGVGTITLNGGALTLHGLNASAGSNIVLNSGIMTLNGGTYAPSSGNLTVVGATAANTTTVKFTNSATTNLSGSLYIGGTDIAAGVGTGLLNVESSSSVAFAGPTKLWTGGTLNVLGGTFKTSQIQQLGGSFSFSAGGLYLSGSDFNLGTGGLLGPSLNLASGSANRNTLSVSGTTTLDAGSSLTINGGTFSTGKLVNNGGAITFGLGTFSITNDNLTIGAGSAVGTTVNLTSGRTLNVSGVVTIDPGATLTVNGGSFSASSLVNNGSFSFLSGTLGGSSDLVIDPGQILGANLTLGAGRNISSSQGLLVGKVGTATMTLTAGGTTSSARGYIGQLAGSNGTVSLSGPGSKWSITSTLAIGGGDATAGGAASLTVSNGASVSAGSTVKIYPAAVVTIDAASLSGSVITNQGQLELANAVSISGALNNAALLKKTGIGVATVSGALNSTGAVQVLGGILSLGGGAGTSSGSFTIADGATLSFAGAYGIDPTSTLAATATFSGAGRALFVDGFHLFNGAINLPAVTIANGSARLKADSTVTHLIINATTTTNFPGLFVDKTLNVQTLDFTSGQLGGTGVINVSGPINFTGTASKTIAQATINASGNTLWTDGGTVGMSGATFNNLADATFEVRHTVIGPRIVFGGTSVFNNYGNFLKETGDTYVEIASTFNNYGTVSLQKGSLQFRGGGSSTGSFTGAAGTTFIIGDQTDHPTTFQPTSAITTDGNLEFQGKPINFSGHLNVAGTTKSLNATFLPGADLQSFGTSLFVTGATTFSTGATQTLPATTLNYVPASINGTDDLTLTGPFTWIGGLISDTGHLRLNAGGSITTTNPKTLTGGTIDNAGVLVWDGGTITQKSTFNNLAAGTLDIRGSDGLEIDFSAPAGSAVFNNGGAIIKSAGALSNIYPTFNNTGSVDVRAGTLTFARDSSSTGPYTVASGAKLTFFFGTHTFAPSASITGDGDVSFNESTATLGGNYAVNGSTTVGSSTASGSTTLVTFQPGSSIANLGSQLTINTYGTLALNTGNTVSLHNLAVWGTLTGSDKITIDGLVSGNGVIQNEITNDGVISPGASPGTLRVKGNYTQRASGSLKIEIAPLATVGTKYPQQFDILNITGQAHLTGTLNIVEIDGLAPHLGDSFDVMTYSARIGRFSTITGIEAGGNLSFAATYLSNALRLTVARPGDADLDQSVGFSDLVTLAQHYNAADQDWTTGDFTGDGVVDFQDLVTLAQNYGAGSQLPPIPGATPAFYQDWAAISAPEPAAANVLFTLALLRLLCRKKKVV